MSDTTLITTIPKAAISISGINALHSAATSLAEEARNKANAATQMALVIGLKLSALKAATPHGQWEKLFKGAERRVGKPSNDAHVRHLEFGIDTARRYIAVATEIINRKLTPEQAQALQHIALATELSPADAELLADITPPETLRQLYLQLGIVKPTRRELLAMEEPPENQEPKKPAAAKTITETIAAKKAEARSFWFGTAQPGVVDKGSYVMVLNMEARKRSEGRFRHLPKDDLLHLAELFQTLHQTALDLAKDK